MTWLLVGNAVTALLISGLGNAVTAVLIAACWKVTEFCVFLVSLARLWLATGCAVLLLVTAKKESAINSWHTMHFGRKCKDHLGLQAGSSINP